MKKEVKPKYMYKDFEEYAEILGITKSNPQWGAFKMIWLMARTPYSVLEQLSAQV